ncbi:MAG: DUF448 domain-containing protein [Myxococcota bacterium]
MAHTGRKRPGPIRTCAGCREKDAPDALLRFAVCSEPPFVAPDVGGRLGGRGVSVHPRRKCLDDAVAKGGFARTLRRRMPMAAGEVAALAAQQYRRRAEGLLSSAHRAGHTAVGTDAVREAMQRGRAQLLVVAADAANRREDLTAQAERLGGACVILGTKVSLGRLLGKAEAAVVAVGEPELARQLGGAVARAKALEGDGAEVR